MAAVMPQRKELTNLFVEINGTLQEPLGGLKQPLSAYEHCL